MNFSLDQIVDEATLRELLPISSVIDVDWNKGRARFGSAWNAWTEFSRTTVPQKWIVTSIARNSGGGIALSINDPNSFT